MFNKMDMNLNNMNFSKNLVNKLWQFFDLFRGLKVDDLQVVFLLISAYKDDVLNKSINLELSNVNHSTISPLYNSDKYFEIFQVYEELIQTMSELKLSKFYLLMNSLEIEELEYLKSNFSEIFESLLEKYLSYVSKNSVVVIQPEEVTSFVNDLAQLGANSKVYNPFAGLASYSLNLELNTIYYGQELMGNTWALGMLRLLAHNDSSEIYYSVNGTIKAFQGSKVYDCDDSIDFWPKEEKFDLVVATPPFRMKLPNFLKSEVTGEPFGFIENFIIEKGLNSLKTGGQLITVFSTSFLFSSARNDFKLKKHLINENLIQSIIQLPSGLFPNTSVSICIVIFKDTSIKSGYVRFIDGSSFYSLNKFGRKVLNVDALSKSMSQGAENEFIRNVNCKQVAENDFDLTTNRYLIGDFEGVKLSSLFKIEKGTTASEMESYPLVRVKDILNSTPYLDSSILAESAPKIIPRLVKGEFLLVNTFGSRISSAITKKSQTTFFSHSFIQVLKLIEPENVDLEYINYVFESEEVLNQIKAFTGGSSKAIRLRSKDLLSIKIPLPSLEDQKLYVVNQLRSIIQNEEAALAQLKRESGIDDADDISYLRHSLAGSVKNVRDSFAKVLSILENQVFNQNPELRLLTTTSRSKITLQQHLEIINADMTEVKNVLNRTSLEIDVRTMNKTTIDFIDFLKNHTQILAANRGNEFRTKFIYDYTLLENSQLQSIYILGNKEMLRQALDNVVDNAVKHAFQDEKNPLIEFELLFDFESDNMLQLDILSNVFFTPCFYWRSGGFNFSHSCI